MAEKPKKRLSRRAQERLNAKLRAFDLTMLGLAVVIVCSGAVCFLGDPSLDAHDPAGFGVWFLRLYAFPPLGVWHGVKALLKLPGGMSRGYGLYILPAIAFAWNFALWLAIRIMGKRDGKSPVLHVATRFAQMVLVWGIFQLFCAGAAAGCRHHMGAPADHAARTVQSAPEKTPAK